MAVGKKAKIFVKQLAQRLADSHSDSAVLERSTRLFYNAAISSLQDEELLKHLSNHADSYILQLCRSIRHLLHMVPERENNNFPSELPFNLFHPSARTVNKSVTKTLTSEKQILIYTQDFINKLQEDDGHDNLHKSFKNFKSYMKQEMEQSPLEATCDILASASSSMAVTADVKAKMMGLYLRGLDPVVRKCVAGKDVERASRLQKKVKTFLMWSQILHSPREMSDKSKHAMMEVTAGIMKNYLDLTLLSHRPGLKGGELRQLDTSLYSFVTYLLDLEEAVVLEVLLKLRTISAANRPALESLIRFALLNPPALVGEDLTQQYWDYLRYMVAVVRLAAPLPALRDIVDGALAVPAPKKLTRWLGQRADLSEWPLHRKFRGLMVSHFLLKEAGESVITDVFKLLQEEKGVTMQSEGGQSKNPDAEAPSQPGFFIDAGPGVSSQPMEIDEEETAEEKDGLADAQATDADGFEKCEEMKSGSESEQDDGLDSDEESGSELDDGEPLLGELDDGESPVAEDAESQVFDLSTMDFTKLPEQYSPTDESAVRERTPKPHTGSKDRSTACPSSPLKQRQRHAGRKGPSSPVRPGGAKPRRDRMSQSESKGDSDDETMDEIDVITDPDDSDKEDVSGDEFCVPCLPKYRLQADEMVSEDVEEKKELSILEETVQNFPSFMESASPRKSAQLHNSSPETPSRQRTLSQESKFGQVGGNESPRKSSRLRDRNHSESSVVTNQSEQEVEMAVSAFLGKRRQRSTSGLSAASSRSSQEAAVPMPRRTRRPSARSGSSVSSTLGDAEVEASVSQKSSRKRTFSDSSVATNLSDKDAETQATKPKARGKSRGRKSETVVPGEADMDLPGADGVEKKAAKPARGRSRSHVTSTGEGDGACDLKVTSPAKSSKSRPAATSAVKRYSLRSGVH